MRETEPAASTAARTKPATAADRLVSGHATTISLALRSLTGTKARPGWYVATAGGRSRSGPTWATRRRPPW